MFFVMAAANSNAAVARFRQSSGQGHEREHLSSSEPERLAETTAKYNVRCFAFSSKSKNTAGGSLSLNRIDAHQTLLAHANARIWHGRLALSTSQYWIKRPAAVCA
jgi:hypothetical protein